MNTTVRALPYYREPSDIFERYRDWEMAVFLDSSLQNTLGRYSIIGLLPYLILKEEDGICYENGVPCACPLEERLSALLAQSHEEHSLPLPLIGGAIGYFSYDYGRKFEQIPTRHEKKLCMPEALFVFYDLLVIADRQERQLYLTAQGKTRDAGLLLDEIQEELSACVAHPAPPKQTKLAAFHPNFTKNAYKAAIDRMISYIVEGDIYIANMTQQLSLETDADPYDVYRYLRTHNAAPFGGYFQYGDFQIACASPERFLRVKDGMVETRPIKGTRKRGATPTEDAALKQELLHSSKDRSELLMIVDLERNDLSHVCLPGSVQVTEHFAVEAYATVFHLVTTVVGELRQGLPVSDLIRAVFPGGSITGAPKIRAMEIIDELEHDRRGLYTGSIGYFSFDGSCDFNIVIRTAIFQNGICHLGVGGGITCESDLEFEYEETLQKAKALLEAIAAKGGAEYDLSR